MDLELNGKSALITGGAGGLGLAIAKGLFSEGVHNVLVDLKTPTDNHEIWSSILEADLSQLDRTEQLISEAVSSVGNLDILVNCAGIWPTHFVRDTTQQQWRRTMDINMTSVFLLCRDFVNHCIQKHQSGVILNITSQAAFGGATSGHADYAAAKAAMVNFTKSLAREVARDNIRINALAPGMMETSMSAQAIADRKDQYLTRIPMGRISQPEEVADVAVFLCSARAGYMTGTTVDVSGGMLMH